MSSLHKVRSKSALPSRSCRINFSTFHMREPTSTILSSTTNPSVERIIDPAFMKYERTEERKKLPHLPDVLMKTFKNYRPNTKKRVLISMDKEEVAKRFRKKMIKNSLNSMDKSSSSSSCTNLLLKKSKQRSGGRKSRLRRKKRTQRSRTPGRNILFMSTTTTTTTTSSSSTGIMTSKGFKKKGNGSFKNTKRRRKRRKKKVILHRPIKSSKNTANDSSTSNNKPSTSTSPPLIVNYGMTEEKLNMIKEKREKMKSYGKMFTHKISDNETKLPTFSPTLQSNHSSSSSNKNDGSLCVGQTTNKGRPRSSKRSRKTRPPSRRGKSGRYKSSYGSSSSSTSSSGYRNLLDTVRNKDGGGDVLSSSSSDGDQRQSVRRSGKNRKINIDSKTSIMKRRKQKHKLQKKQRPKTAPRYISSSRGLAILGNVKHLPPVKSKSSHNKVVSRGGRNCGVGKFTIIAPPKRKNSTGSSHMLKKKKMRLKQKGYHQKIGSGICLRRPSDAKQNEKFAQGVTMPQLKSFRFGDQNDEWKNYSQIDLHIDTIMYEYFIESTMQRYRQIDLLDRFYEHVPSEVVKRSYRMRMARKRGGGGNKKKRKFRKK